jgi:hypothetical protein
VEDDTLLFNWWRTTRSFNWRRTTRSFNYTKMMDEYLLTGE